jgi:hypothetical protein
MTEKDAIAQKPFCRPCNMVTNRMLQIQHTVGNHLLTRLNQRLKSTCLQGFMVYFVGGAAILTEQAAAGAVPWT